MRSWLLHAPWLSAVLFLAASAFYFAASQNAHEARNSLELTALQLLAASVAVILSARAAGAAHGIRFATPIVRWSYLLVATAGWFALIWAESLQSKGPPGLHLGGPGVLQLLLLVTAIPGILITLAAIGSSLWVVYIGIAMRDSLLE